MIARADVMTYADSSDERGLSAGVARVVITPPVGIPLVGYNGRPPATGIHDDLTATALVLSERRKDGDDLGSRVAIVALDLVGLHGDVLAASIKACVEAATSIPPDRVFLNCSHTHYGPVLAEFREGGDTAVAAAYRDALPHYVAGVVAMASSSLRPVRLAVGRGAVRVGINRRERGPDGRIRTGQNPDGSLDSEVLVCRFDAAEEPSPEPGAPAGWLQRTSEPVAVLVNYACHGVSLGGTIRLISADFPGVMRGVVERSVGGTCLYLQGAAGNINPVLMGPDWEHPRRLGKALGAEAARVALAAQEVGALPLHAARARVDLPARLPPSREAALAQLAALEAEWERVEARIRSGGEPGSRWRTAVELESARRALAAIESGESLPPVPADLGALRIGDVALATNPSELFCEIGMAIKRNSPFPWTGVAGYTDGVVGYIPHRAAYAEGGYGVDYACPVNPEAGELVEGTSITLLRSLAAVTGPVPGDVSTPRTVSPPPSRGRESCSTPSSDTSPKSRTRV